MRCLLLLLAACGVTTPPSECTTNADCETLLADRCPGGSVVLASCSAGRCAFEGCSSPVGTPDDGDPATAFDGECEVARPATWPRCDGLERTIDGVAATSVANHPMIAGPALGPDATAPTQHYMDVGGSQIIVVTTESTRCEGAMRATGRLSYIDLGGEPGTPRSYTGLAVLDARITCPP